MLNLDKLQARKTEIRNTLAAAIRENDEEKIKAAMDDWQSFVSEQIMEQTQGMSEATDRNILAARGIRQLTAKETAFYERFIESAKQEGVITNITDVLPETVIDSVMDDMRQEYPLLNMIDFTNTGAAIKWVLNAQGAQAATWDELNTEIKTKLGGAINVVDMTFCKLTAYMFCTTDMLDLGPRWVDAYCRTVLSGALSAGLESGIVDGNGLKQPIGMTRNFKGDRSESTGYPRKAAIEVTSLDPKSYGAILSTLTKDELGNQRAVSRVVLIVNPTDYMTKVMPATTMLTPNGQYVRDVLPFPTDIVQSVGVPEGHAVIGIVKKYFMGVGTSKGGKLEYSDDYKFVEDLRTYKIKFYGNGRPYDINCFAYLDISKLEPVLAAFYNTITGSIETTSDAGDDGGEE